MHIQDYDHFGIRVTDRDRALAFYEALGFRIDPNYSNDRVAEVVNSSGIRLNLIFNGRPHPNGNVLLDDPVKWPGYTHAAFTVERMEDVLAWAEAHQVRITEGPVDWGRRLTCFLRDPDQNVLEFNELKTDPEVSA